MKTRIALAVIVLILFSCKKESANKSAKDTGLPKKTYEVGFKVSGFTESTKPLSTKAVNTVTTGQLKDKIKYLHYFIFSVYIDDLDNIFYTEVSTGKQLATDPDFGTINQTLEAGHYAIYFIGTQAPGHYKFVFKTAVSPIPIFYYDDGSVYETFHKALQLDISGPSTQAVELKRTVAEISVKITDPLPASANAIRLSFGDAPRGLDMNSGTGEYRAHGEWDLRDTAKVSFPVKATDIGQSGFTVDKFVWQYQYYGIVVDCLNVDGKVIATKTLPKNYFGDFTQLLNNTHYIYTGELFGNTSNFSVSLDDQWNAPVNVPFRFYPMKKN
jgi:hypothetical protein